MLSCSRGKTGTLLKANEKLYKSSSLGKKMSFCIIQAFFFHFLPPGRDVCSFLIPSKQAVNALKHEVTCTIMKASVGEPLLPPQALLLQPGRSLPSSPGSVQAAWSASTYRTFWGPLPSYLDDPPQVQ